MKYRYILSLMAILSMLILNSCKKTEAALSPSGIVDGYVLPQGNHAFDAEIVNYYNKYNTYLLYKFNYEDIYWTPTGYNVPKMYSGGYWSSGHEVTIADETYIPAQLALIKASLFDLYPEKFLKKFLPGKILLCSKVDSIYAAYDFTSFSYTKGTKSIGAYSYYNSICVNYGNANVATMTAGDKTVFLKKINAMLVENIIARSLTKPTLDFTNSADYATAMTTFTQSYGKGIIVNYYGPTALADWNEYIRVMVTLSETQLNMEIPMPGPYDYPSPTSLGILNPSKDINGQIRKRYAIVRNYFISEYGIDLQTIGNKANPQ